MEAVIFDLDGTLADCSHRLHHVRHGKRDWDAFFADMAADTVVAPIRTLASAMLEAGYEIVICSGRPEKYRDVTVRWLVDNNIGFSALYMRPNGDFRADHIVKSQILDGMIDDGFSPFMAITDRPQLVEMWSGRNIACLQCASVDMPEMETA